MDDYIESMPLSKMLIFRIEDDNAHESEDKKNLCLASSVSDLKITFSLTIDNWSAENQKK
jgi:hypothetical protein